MSRLRLVLITVFMFLVSFPVFAGSKACTAAMVTAGICRNQTDRVVYLSVDAAHVQDVVDALADEAGWTAQVVCTQSMVDLGQCNLGQLGQLVANPVTKAAAADAQFRRRLVTLVRSWKAETVHSNAEQTRQSGLAGIQDPNIGEN